METHRLIPPIRICLLLVALAACSTREQAPLANRILTDDIGREVRVPRPPRRIVSLAPSVTETIFALGVGDRVVGVTDFCDYPPEARYRSRVGGLVNPSWETILDLRPDLLVASTAGNDSVIVSQAEALHLPLFFVDTPNVEETIRSIRRVGVLVGAERASARLERNLRERLRNLQLAAGSRRHPRVLYLVWGDPIVVPGGQTFLSDALARAGFDSITFDAPAGWPTYDLETILLRRPEWILATRQNAGFLRTLNQKPGWRELEAVRRGRVVVVSEALERPSPRVVEALEELHRIVTEGGEK